MSEEALKIAIGVMIVLAFVATALIVGECGSRCVIERYNCRPALRGVWDHGPVIHPDVKCEERCKK